MNIEGASTFPPMADRPSFPANEEKILEFWRAKNTFIESHKLSAGRPPFIFFDGPPFATGLPHYGHILAGTIKDVVTRYAYQTGHHVERRFGWDCHGLPVEHEIDKTLGIKNRQDVVSKIGIPTYNEKCRSIVMKYQKEWRNTIERSGRWIDFDDDYKTMDLSFMESVWWAFSELFKKGLVYRDFKVMPFSTGCCTPLSNFEAGQDYRDIHDPSITVSFKIKDSPTLGAVEILAWTTTPWTLPSNMALCVHPEFTYVVIEIKNTGKRYLVAESRCRQVLKEMKYSQATIEGGLSGTDTSVLAKIRDDIKGKDLEGVEYEPIFDFFSRDVHWKSKAWRVLCDPYVTSDTGTGIVHNAPGFGEDDYRICLKYGIIQKGGQLPCPVDECGCFTLPVDQEGLLGVYVKEADKKIKSLLKTRGVLLANDTIVHSYPHCWRSHTPLLYKAVPSWFVRVEEIKDVILQNNTETKWVPKTIQTKRFHNWLADARDWCISRNRFWGTPIPLWVAEDFSQVVCVSSVAQLQEFSPTPISNIHREFIDNISIPDPRGPTYPALRRVDEVFDCWFESGCMPYAQVHFPFENKEKFLAGFPADFVGEGIDQTRGWFYTLSVLGAGLFGKAPFKNLIVNGLVLADDGKKMSKSQKNYPAPEQVFASIGSDPLRLFLVSSPVVRGESVRFSEEGVRDIVKTIFLPWYHALRFFTQEVTRLEISERESSYRWRPLPQEISLEILEEKAAMLNTMDRWILSLTHSLAKFVHEEMQNYRLYTSVGRLLLFLDQLTNWYVRLNRDRMRGTRQNVNSNASLSILFEVLFKLILLMAPFTPMLSEYFYQILRSAMSKGDARYQDSVHFLMLPSSREALISPDLENSISQLQKVINLGRIIRDRHKISIRKPLKKITVVSCEQDFIASIQSLSHYIQDELNILDAEFKVEIDSLDVRCLPNLPVLGKRYGKELKTLAPKIRSFGSTEVNELEKQGYLEVDGVRLVPNDIIISRCPANGLSESNELGIEFDSSCLVTIELQSSDELRRVMICRAVTTKVQKLRKDCGLKLEDEVITNLATANGDDGTSEVAKILRERKISIEQMLRRKVFLNASLSKKPFACDTFDIYGDLLTVEFFEIRE